jgi:hypothetical protein
MMRSSQFLEGQNVIKDRAPVRAEHHSGQHLMAAGRGETPVFAPAVPRLDGLDDRLCRTGPARRADRELEFSGQSGKALNFRRDRTERRTLLLSQCRDLLARRRALLGEGGDTFDPRSPDPCCETPRPPPH